MRKIVFIAVVALVVVGCGGGRKKDFMRGEVVGGVYRNDFFGVTMEVPEGMYVMPRAAMDSIAAAAGAGMGSEVAGYSDLLLFISAREPAAADSLFNYNITVTSEKLPEGTEVKNNAQYISTVIKMLDSKSDAEHKMDGLHVELNGREIAKMSIRRGSVSQDIYTSLHDGYALVVVASYDGVEQREAVDRIIGTMTF